MGDIRHLQASQLIIHACLAHASTHVRGEQQLHAAYCTNCVLVHGLHVEGNAGADPKLVHRDETMPQALIAVSESQLAALALSAHCMQLPQGLTHCCL